MGYDVKRDETVVAPGSGVETSVAPGKSTRSGAIRTRVPIVDDGTACERDETLSCYLTTEKRAQLLGAIGLRAIIVGENARDAIADTRMDELLRDETTWGPLAEFLFYSATGWMIGGILHQVSRNMKPEKYEKYKEHISATLTNASRGFRKTLQGNAAAAGDHAKASKVRFLELVRDGIPLWQDAFVTGQATKNLDDDGLVGLMDGLNPALHPVAEFKAKLVDMLARFDKQQIDQVGVSAIYRHGELMWITRGGKRRLIMLEDHGLHHYPATALDAPKPRDLVEKMGRDGKPIVIDPDLESMTVALFAERTGRPPFEIDAEKAVAMGGAMGKVASELIVDALTGALTLGGAR